MVVQYIVKLANELLLSESISLFITGPLVDRFTTTTSWTSATCQVFSLIFCHLNRPISSSPRSLTVL